MYMKRFFCSLISVSFLLTGCYTNYIEENAIDSDCMFVVDEFRETGYDCMLLAPVDGYVDLIKKYDNNNYEEIIVLHGNEYEEAAVIRFYENGLLKSVSGESATIAFSNYKGNKVDVAFLYEEDMTLIKEYECSEDWSKYFTLTDNDQTKGDDQDSRWEKGLDYIQNQFENLIEFAVDAHFMNDAPHKLAFGWLGDIVTDSLKLILSEKAAPYIALGEVTFDGVLGGPWVAFATLMSNYDEYVDWVEDVSYSLITKLNKVDSNEGLALGSLNSGYGALKATLSWSFYADIDLHAVEPSGTHIYWSDPTSYCSGGYLDVDNTEGGPNSVENIYWKEAEDGTYRFYIDYYGPSTYNYADQSGVCRVAILYKGQSIGVHNISMTSNDTKDVRTITLTDGMYSGPSSSHVKVEMVINKKERKGTR